MASTVALTIEGVLAQGEAATLPNNKPITEGLALYHSLKTMFKIALVTDCDDTDKIEHWCKMHGLREHPYTIPSSIDYPRRESQWTALTVAHRLHVDIVIDSDPRLIQAAFNKGMFGLLFVSPAYARPEFRPDYEQKPTPWDELVADVTNVRMLRANDPRRDADTV